MRIVLYFFIVLLCISSGSVAAQTTTATSSATSTPPATTTPPVTQPPVTEPDRSVILERRAQERIINLAANISNKFDAIIARLGNITNRLNNRIQKMKVEGYDTAAAEASLLNAQTALNEARIEMSTIDRAVIDAVGSQSPKTEWQKVRAKYFFARERIKSAHTDLKLTVASLKDASKITAPVTATTSETSSE